MKHDGPVFRLSTLWSTALLSCLTLTSACGMFSGPRHHTEVRSPETDVKKTVLSSPPVAVHKLDFDDPIDGARMKPKDRGQLRDVDGAVASDSSLPAVADLQKQALANTAVRGLLGARYALIGTQVVDPGYKQPSGCCGAAPPKIRLTFFSYSNNSTIDVDMKGSDVANVSRRKDYLPPEGEEEIVEAVALARKDDRIAAAVKDLDGHGILTQPGDGLLWNDPGYGHRVFWVTFSKGLSGNPEYWALVDMTEQKVLKAQKEDAHP
jgi:hypothetical protein